MSDWVEYVRKFYALSPEEQLAEWEKLTPDQRTLFESARSSTIQPPPDLPRHAAKTSLEAGPLLKGCLAVAVAGVLVISALAFLASIDQARERKRAREAAERRAEEAAEAEREAILYFKKNEAAILDDIEELLSAGDFKQADALATKYLPSENDELAALHERATAGLEEAKRQAKIEELLEKVRKVPASDALKNRDLYRELRELDPEEALYEEKVAFYSNKVDENVQRARQEREEAERKRAQEKKERQLRVARFGEAPVASAWDGSYLAVERYLEQIANDPDSIEIAGCTEVYNTDKGWLVGCDYRGRNAFGGIIRQSNWFTIVHDRVVEMHDASVYQP